MAPAGITEKIHLSLICELELSVTAIPQLLYNELQQSEIRFLYLQQVKMQQRHVNAALYQTQAEYFFHLPFTEGCAIHMKEERHYWFTDETAVGSSPQAVPGTHSVDVPTAVGGW